MEQPLSSELIKRLTQWPGDIQDSAPKNSLTMIDNIAEQNNSQVPNGEVVNGNTEDENPALDGHFLTERSIMDVAIIDNCECQCHRQQQPTFELNLPFSCSKCSQQFCCKCQFLVHRDFHRGERKYTCQVCNKSYYYKSDLVRHQPVHSDIKPHMCKVCGRSFNQVGHLITHRLVHTGEKPFPCDVCHKPFNRKSNLQKHKMIHTGERPFMCLVCGSRFSRKGDLQRHTMLHTGERPYKCQLCDKSFSQKPHLLSHQSVHTGEKPYKCLACGKSFNRKSNLIKHQIAKCPALSLKRSDGSDLQLSDIGPMASSSFFNHFNHLIVNKTEIIDSDDQKSYFDSIELKPIISMDDNDPENHLLSNTSNGSLPDHSMHASNSFPMGSSVLRARLSNTTVNVSTNNVVDVSVGLASSSTIPESALMSNAEFDSAVQNNCDSTGLLPSNKTIQESSSALQSQESTEQQEAMVSEHKLTHVSSVSSDSPESSDDLRGNSSESPGQHESV